MPPGDEAILPPVDPDHGDGHGAGSAAGVIRAAVTQTSGGALPFDQFMALALYGEGVGFYTRPRPGGRALTGRGGDFFTSVSVGELFGELVGRQVAWCWEAMGKPERFRWVEAGANDGQLSADVTAWLRVNRPELEAGLEVVLVESSPEGRRLAGERLPGAERVAAVEAVAAGAPTVLFANELLDALPVRRLRWRDGRWWDLAVEIDGSGAGFSWSELEADRSPELAAGLAALPRAGLPDGYTTEVCPGLAPWIGAAGRSLGGGGYLILVDYGYEAPDYYHPSRTDGTLRTYRGHEAGDDPLASPGDVDITAHVDFSAAAAAARRAGLRPFPLTDQHHFLTRLAAPWLRALEDDPAALADARPKLRQFQTLTHPGMMGRAFKVMVAARGDQLPVPPALAGVAGVAAGAPTSSAPDGGGSPIDSKTPPPSSTSPS